jgi:hypothetical protein
MIINQLWMILNIMILHISYKNKLNLKSWFTFFFLEININFA